MACSWSIQFSYCGEVIRKAGYSRNAKLARTAVQRWRSHAEAIFGADFVATVAPVVAPTVADAGASGSQDSENPVQPLLFANLAFHPVAAKNVVEGGSAQGFEFVVNIPFQIRQLFVDIGGFEMPRAGKNARHAAAPGVVARRTLRPVHHQVCSAERGNSNAGGTDSGRVFFEHAIERGAAQEQTGQGYELSDSAIQPDMQKVQANLVSHTANSFVFISRHHHVISPLCIAPAAVVDSAGTAAGFEERSAFACSWGAPAGALGTGKSIVQQRAPHPKCVRVDAP